MAVDAFLYFQSRDTNFVPKGESTDAQFKPFSAFQLESFSFSLKNAVTIGSQSMGAGAGKAEFENFKFTKTIDSGSSVLFSACATGKHVDAAVLVLRKAGAQSTTTS